MSLTTNVKTIQEKTRSQGLSVAKPDIIAKATALGFDIEGALTIPERQLIADSLVKDASSQLAPRQESSNITRQEPKTMPQTTPENSLSVRPSEALANRQSDAIQLNATALQIRELGQTEQIELADKVLENFLAGAMSSKQAYQELLVLVAQAQTAINSAFVGGYNRIIAASDASLQTFVDSIDAQNKELAVKRQESLNAMKAKVKDMFADLEF